MIDEIDETTGNYNSLYSFYRYNRLQLALFSVAIGVVYIGYTIYSNVEIY